MHKILRNILIPIFIILLIYFICFKVFNLDKTIMEIVYPKKYEEYVNKYSKEYNVDNLLIFAIIKAESNFNPNVKSKSDAIGLMQLLENTALELAKKQNQEITEQELYEPETNIKLGTYYFSTLIEQYKNTGVALAAYNAGMGRVNEWIQNEVIRVDGSDLENIPYKETNMYVRKILNDYEIYKDLYN